MSEQLYVDTARVHDLARAGSRCSREIEHESAALRNGAEGAGKATGRGELEAQYASVYRDFLRLLADLSGSLEQFRRALDRIAEGYARADEAAPVMGAGSPTGGPSR